MDHNGRLLIPGLVRSVFRLAAMIAVLCAGMPTAYARSSGGFYFNRAMLQDEEVARWLPLRVQTAHFDIHSDMSRKDVEFYARFFESFTEYFKDTFYPFHQDRPLRVYLFSHQSRFEEFGRTYRRSEELASPFGYYMGPQANVIVLNMERGIGTATHELVHHFVAMGFPSGCPKWVNEGFAMFFEKFIAHFDEEGNLNISLGYFSNWRFPDALTSVGHTTLIDIFNFARPNSVRAFMLFLHRRGLLKTFINELRNAPLDRRGMITLAKVYGDTLNQLFADWEEWMISQQDNPDVQLVKRSFVLSAPEWEKWWKANQHRLYWDPTQEIYRVG